MKMGMMKMNWKKRKKLRKMLQHYQSKRIKSLIRLMNELNATPGKYVSGKTRTAFLKFCKQRPLHNYDEIVRKKAIRQKPKVSSIQTRNLRVYDYNGFMNAINNDKRVATLIKSGKWLGEIDHPSDRLPGGENWGYPVQAHVDIAQNPDVTTEARIGISPEGGVKFYGFDICKR